MAFKIRLKMLQPGFELRAPRSKSKRATIGLTRLNKLSCRNYIYQLLYNINRKLDQFRKVPKEPFFINFKTGVHFYKV